MKSPRPTTPPATADQRIAKVMARAGLCSRREAETWIADGRVTINGHVLATPAVTVKPGDVVLVDGMPLPEFDRTRLWLFHKPRGVVTTTRDPEGRPTVFDVLPAELPRVVTIGRLDINTEGLLLLTNDGGLARVLELPATGWLRRYRVRAHGDIDQARLDTLADGIAVEGVYYGAIEATLDRQQGDNVWITMGLREGKNREIKNVMMHLGMDVNRLIRVSFGPFQLGDLAEGEIREVPRRHLKEQLGETLAAAAGVDLAVREEERRPKMPPKPATRAEERRPKMPPKPATREPERPRKPGRLGIGRPTADEPEAARPRGQKSRREVIEERRAGRTRHEPRVERRARAEPEPVAEDTRQQRSRKPSTGAAAPAPSGARSGRKPYPWERSDAPGGQDRPGRRGELRSKGSLSHPGAGQGGPGRSRGSRPAEAHGEPRPLEGGHGERRREDKADRRHGGHDARPQRSDHHGRAERTGSDRADRRPPADREERGAGPGRRQRPGFGTEAAGGGRGPRGADHHRPGREMPYAIPGKRPRKDHEASGNRSADFKRGTVDRATGPAGKPSGKPHGAPARFDKGSGGAGRPRRDDGPGAAGRTGRDDRGSRGGSGGPGPGGRPGGKGPGGRPGGPGPGGRPVGKGPGGRGADRRR
jgi:23S rRNA pseudouridine2605 synthase